MSSGGTVNCPQTHSIYDMRPNETRSHFQISGKKSICLVDKHNHSDKIHTALRSRPELASPGVKISFLIKGFRLLFPIRDPIEFS
jgi:hypothetical protein